VISYGKMRVQDFIADQTELVSKGIIHNARALPADKLEWKPMGHGRSAMSQLRECAVSPDIFIRALSGKGYNYLDEDKVKSEALDSVDSAERCLNDGNAILLKLIRNLPDERLCEKIDLPWGATWSLIEVANMHYWNLVYHVGQINYLQTLLGDFEMH